MIYHLRSLSFSGFQLLKETCLNDINELEKASLAQVARIEEAKAISEMNADFKSEIEERERKISAERKAKPELLPVVLPVPSPIKSSPEITPQQLQQTKDAPVNVALKDIPEIVRKLSSESQPVFSTNPEMSHILQQQEMSHSDQPARRPSIEKPDSVQNSNNISKIPEPLVDLTDNNPIPVPETKSVTEPVPPQRIEAPTCVPKANSGYSHYNMDSISTVNKNYPIVSISANTGNTGTSSSSSQIAPPSYSQTVKELPPNPQPVQIPVQAVPAPNPPVQVQNQSIPVQPQQVPTRNLPVQNQPVPNPVRAQAPVLPVSNQPIPSQGSHSAQKSVDSSRVKPNSSQNLPAAYQKPVQPPVSQQHAYQQNHRSSSSVPSGKPAQTGFQGHQPSNPFEYRNSLTSRGLDNMASSQHHFPIGNINPLPISKVFD